MNDLNFFGEYYQHRIFSRVWVLSKFRNLLLRFRLFSLLVGSGDYSKFGLRGKPGTLVF